MTAREPHPRLSPEAKTLRCPNCGYSVTALLEHRCPECGQRFDPDGLAYAQYVRPRPFNLWRALLHCSWPPALFWLSLVLFAHFGLGAYGILIAGIAALVLGAYVSATNVAESIAIRRSIQTGALTSGLERRVFIALCGTGVYLFICLVGASPVVYVLLRI